MRSPFQRITKNSKIFINAFLIFKKWFNSLAIFEPLVFREIYNESNKTLSPFLLAYMVRHAFFLK